MNFYLCHSFQVSLVLSLFLIDSFSLLLPSLSCWFCLVLFKKGKKKALQENDIQIDQPTSTILCIIFHNCLFIFSNFDILFSCVSVRVSVCVSFSFNLVTFSRLHPPHRLCFLYLFVVEEVRRRRETVTSHCVFTLANEAFIITSVSLLLNQKLFFYFFPISNRHLINRFLHFDPMNSWTIVLLVFVS